MNTSIVQRKMKTDETTSVVESSVAADTSGITNIVMARSATRAEATHAIIFKFIHLLNV